jgi:geranylgeranyl pyrophosphate synthase
LSLSLNVNRQAELLRKELEEILAPLSNESEICAIIMEHLVAEGRDSSLTKSQKPWAILPLAVADSICGKSEQAVPAALALQLFMAAGDIFDDIEDSDSPNSIASKYGNAIATNVGTTLLILAEKSLTKLRTGILNDPVSLRTIEDVNSYFLKACIGQHSDLSNSKIDIDENKYLELVALKSASQIECSCHLGASIATHDKNIIRLFEIFGNNLGMAAQISNDISGIIADKDIIKRKVTLPVIFALSHADETSKSFLINYYSSLTSNGVDTNSVKVILFNSGAVQYSCLRLNLYQEYARETLAEIKALGISSVQLEDFLN